jgi:holo-[acyl-carrier protein] synthase
VRIIGLGVDLAEVDRVRSLLARYGDSFRRRCFTEHEWEYAHRFSDPAGRLAARFAGKEAVMKSLGTGWRRLRWTDIEITGGGRPRAVLTGRAAIRADMLSVSEVLVTVTHTKEQAVVMAIAVGEDD